MYLKVDELKTHLRGEIVDIISRGDEVLAQSAIDTAIVEAKGYLSQYDTDKIFNTEDGQRNPLLLTFVKDIAVWHFINICNVNVDFEIRKLRYERAVAWLKDVQRGNVNPDLPAKPENETVPGILFGSNPKRVTHY